MRVKLPASSFRVGLLTVFALLSLMATSRTTLACDCITASEKERLRRSELVFEGEVVRIAEVDHRTVYTFAVSKVIKGSANGEVTITDMGTNCDQYFFQGFVYRVFASRFQDKLISGQCSGNIVLNKRRRT